MSKESTSNGGIGVLGLLGVAFVVLKLCGIISWSWWYVTMPLWIGIPVVILILLGIIVYTLTTNKRVKNPKKSRFQITLEELAEKRKGS
jgi:membrane protein YdbS with pleckstrin-like domain